MHHVFQPATSPSAPPLLLLHGTGGDESDLIPLGQALSPGSALLSPRGSVSENGAPRFFRRFAEGVFDLEDVRRRTSELADFVRDSATKYKFDTSKLVAVGFSNGANIAASLLLLHPESLLAAILFRAMVVLDQPAAPGSLKGKRVFMSNGTHDPIISSDQPARLATHLRAGGADVTLHTFPASHGLTKMDISAAQEWIRHS